MLRYERFLPKLLAWRQDLMSLLDWWNLIRNQASMNALQQNIQPWWMILSTEADTIMRKSIIPTITAAVPHPSLLFFCGWYCCCWYLTTCCCLCASANLRSSSLFFACSSFFSCDNSEFSLVKFSFWLFRVWLVWLSWLFVLYRRCW